MQGPKTVASENKVDQQSTNATALGPKTCNTQPAQLLQELHPQRNNVIHSWPRNSKATRWCHRQLCRATGLPNRGSLLPMLLLRNKRTSVCKESSGPERRDSCPMVEGELINFPFPLSQLPPKPFFGAPFRSDDISFQEGLGALRIPLMMQNTDYQCSLWSKCSPWELLLFIFQNLKNSYLVLASPYLWKSKIFMKVHSQKHHSSGTSNLKKGQPRLLILFKCFI